MAIKKICILGLGHAGVPLSAIIALKCPEIRVTVVQTNSEYIFQLNVKRIPPPIYVPGLEELIRKCQNKNLFFTTNEGEVIKEADAIFILSESSLKTYGAGKDECVDLSLIEEAAYLIAEHAESNKIVVENSAIPFKSAECVKSVLKYNSRPNLEFDVVSNPEFYEEGSPIRNLLYPDCILVGSDDTPRGILAAKIIGAIYERWVPAQKIVMRTNWTVELSKISTSAMVAQRLSSVYAMTAICEESGGDVVHLINVLMKDSRIGPAALEPTLHVGKFPSALRTLIYMCEFCELHEAADYWRQVLIIYELHKERFFNRLMWTLNQTAWNKRVAILGFAYYKDTEVTKGSAAIYLCKAMAEEMVKINVYDSRVTKEKVIDDLVAAECAVSKEELKKLVCVYDDPYLATSKTQVIIGCGVWADFAHLDFNKIFSDMVKPAFIFDSGNIFDHIELLKIGFKVYSSGKLVKNSCY